MATDISNASSSLMANTGANCNYRRQWSAKRWVFVSLSVLLALIPIIIAINVILRPRTILLSIAKASTVDIILSVGKGKTLNLTIMAENTDHHASVEYHSVVADLLYTSGILYSIPAEVTMPSTPQRPLCTTTIEVSANFTKDVLKQYFDGSASNRNITVRITAEVKFIVGSIYTRPYTVSVECNPTPFFNLSATRWPINCTG